MKGIEIIDPKDNARIFFISFCTFIEFLCKLDSEQKFYTKHLNSLSLISDSTSCQSKEIVSFWDSILERATEEHDYKILEQVRSKHVSIGGADVARVQRENNLFLSKDRTYLNIIKKHPPLRRQADRRGTRWPTFTCRTFTVRLTGMKSFCTYLYHTTVKLTGMNVVGDCKEEVTVKLTGMIISPCTSRQLAVRLTGASCMGKIQVLEDSNR
ncbi:8232_t:CDS:2 [Acaulospora morrowiae]|uniref:8232_t:CDS:1 n=1 Tax=Acaulospora morrowiae TaxID=94023 RepID=A0A9N8WCL1_9GLOM|nr:8232_t:CDS:2 [Acaulospora morrowiae]